MPPRRYCITGATGCLGRALVEEALAQGHACRVFVRDAGKFSLLPGVERAEVVEGNFDDRSALRQALASVDVVVHCATSQPGLEGGDVKDREALDGAMLEALLQEASLARPRIVLPSSRFVYGIPLERPIPETHRLAEENAAGRRHLRLEALLGGEEAETSLPCSIVRFPEVLGPGFHGERMQRLFRRALDGASLTGYGNPTLLTEFIHARDAARACLMVSQATPRRARIYNAPGPEPISWQAWYELVRDCAASTAELTFVPLPLLRKERWFRAQRHIAYIFAFDVLLDGTKLRRDHGFTHAYSNRDIVRSALAWLRQAREEGAR